MKAKTKQHGLRRRDFLIRGAVTMGAAASLAIAGRANSAPVEPDASQGASTVTTANSGYRLTPHIKDYYAKARF